MASEQTDTVASVKLEKGVVLEGPLWPEPVRISGVESYGDLWQVDAVGLRTRQFYPGTILTQAELPRLKMTASSALDFSGDAEAFHLAIEAQRIRLAHEVDPHFAVSSSSITPLPHQLEAVYRYMLTSPLVRFLLADDPGAGKTIMAGLLLKELRFRGLADRVLIVVPPLVSHQWQEELRSKFSEEFIVVDSGLRDANAGRNPFTENDRCITSLYWAAREEVIEPLKEADWDLIIVDEAHKMAAYRQGKRVIKTTKTQLYRLGEELSLRTKHLLMLTATPHKGDPENFRLLLELLDKDLFAERSILEEAMRRQDNPIILRRLKEEMRKFDGSPLFPPRTVKTVTFNLSKIEEALYQEVTAYVTEHFNKALHKEKRNIGFAMTIMQRRLTSSLAAITASLKRRRARLADLLQKVRSRMAGTPAQLAEGNSEPLLSQALGGAPVESMEDLGEAARWQAEDILIEGLTNAESVEELETEVLALDRLVRRAQAAAGDGQESKFNELCDSILRDGGLRQRGEKLLIFTEAKDTLDFLVEQLRARGFTVAVIDGSLPMEKRRAQQELFRGKAEIMIATEAGGESINLQFCNQMVNYDIPWNPNRLEQRMGRIHRIGQRNEVFIFDLVATDTREGEVLHALLRKIEQMRIDLHSDRVFDMVGELLEDHDISLSDLIIDCITRRRRIEDAVATLENAVSPEHQAALLRAREEGLAHRLINLPRLRSDMARSAGHALIPAHLESFVAAVVTRHRGRAARRADGTLRIERVPVELRREQELDFQRKHGAIAREYPSVTSEKTRIGDDGKVEFLSPAHPLFRSTLLAAEASCAAALPRGAVYYDPDLREPERLWFFRASVGDGTSRTLAERVLVLRELSGRTFVPSGPLRLHDLRKRDAKDPPPPPMPDFDERRKAALIHCLQHVVPAFIDDVKGDRLKELAIKERYLERSFRVVISRHSDRMLELEAKAQGGQDMGIAIAREHRLMEDTKRRQARRIEEVRLEQQLVTRAPELLGVALVLPEAAEVGRAAAPDDLMAAVTAAEQQAGRALRDVRGQALGYDALSLSSDGQEVRFLLARDLDARGRVWLTDTEWTQLQNLGKDAMLYVGATGGSERMRTLRLDERPLRAQVHERHRRVSLEVDPAG